VVVDPDSGTAGVIKTALLNAICVAALAFDSLSRLFPRGHGAAILVVRLDVVGDFFLWMRTGAVNLSQYARARGDRAVLLANPQWAGYARASGLWDEVIELNERRFYLSPLYRIQTLVRIRRLGAAQLIQTRASRISLLEDSIARVCGIPERISPSGTLFNQTPWQRRLGNRCYERLIPIDERMDTHESRRNAQLTHALTGSAPIAFAFEPAADGLRPAGVAVVLGAGDIGRAWPIERLCEVVRHIDRAYPELSISVLGLQADSANAAQLSALTNGRIRNLVGKTSLAQFVSHIAASRLVVCNESAAYQIALAYGCDIVCFLGGGHYGLFAPLPQSAADAAVTRSRIIDLSVSMSCFGCNWRCIYPRARREAYPCIAAISLPSAIGAVDTLLCRD
jgi:ADP-heptose:LPS heptosyltransferase